MFGELLGKTFIRKKKIIERGYPKMAIKKVIVEVYGGTAVGGG